MPQGTPHMAIVLNRQELNEMRSLTAITDKIVKEKSQTKLPEVCFKKKFNWMYVIE